MTRESAIAEGDLTSVGGGANGGSVAGLGGGYGGDEGSIEAKSALRLGWWNEEAHAGGMVEVPGATEEDEAGRQVVLEPWV